MVLSYGSFAAHRKKVVATLQPHLMTKKKPSHIIKCSNVYAVHSIVEV